MKWFSWSLVSQYKEFKEGESVQEDSSSGSEYETKFVIDEDHSGMTHPSQACFKNGVEYVPPGWKSVLVKVEKGHA